MKKPISLQDIVAVIGDRVFGQIVFTVLAIIFLIVLLSIFFKKHNQNDYQKTK